MRFRIRSALCFRTVLLSLSLLLLIHEEDFFLGVDGGPNHCQFTGWHSEETPCPDNFPTQVYKDVDSDKMENRLCCDFDTDDIYLNDTVRCSTVGCQTTKCQLSSDDPCASLPSRIVEDQGGGDRQVGIAELARESCSMPDGKDGIAAHCCHNGLD